MTRRLLVQPKAREDLLQQGAYLAIEESPVLEQRFLENTERAFARLLEFPTIAQVREFSHSKLGHIRMWPIPEFPRVLIFYRVGDKEVEVIRVLHSSRDIESVLGDQLGE